MLDTSLSLSICDISCLQKRKPNPFLDDEAEEILHQKAKTQEEDLMDDSSESEEHKAKPKEWEVEDVYGKVHKVSIKEVKGKKIFMTSDAYIKVVEGKTPEEAVQMCIDAGDAGDLIE